MKEVITGIAVMNLKKSNLFKHTEQVFDKKNLMVKLNTLNIVNVEVFVCINLHVC